MNYLQLAQRLHRELGRSGAGPVTLVTATTADLRLFDWIADAWRNLQIEKRGWKWMRNSVSGVLVESQQSYAAADLDFVRIAFTAGSAEYVRGDALVQGAVTATVTRAIVTSGDWSTSDAAGELIIVPVSGEFVAGAALGDGACNLSGPAVSLAAFGRWHVATDDYTVRCSMTATPSEVFDLSWVPYDQFQAAYIVRTIEDGRPHRWSVAPSGRLLIAPAADATGYGIAADYWANPTELTVDADEPDMPDEFHMLLLWRAMVEGAYFDAAPEVLTRAAVNLRKMMFALELDQAAEIALNFDPIL